MSSAAPLAVPASPSSSKRSRSRDSTRSGATSSLTTPSSHTPSASAPSLLIPSPGGEVPPVVMDSSQEDPTPYPAFLRLSKSDVHQKFVDLEWEQRRRGMEGGNHGGESEQPSQWSRCTGEDALRRNRYVNVDPYQANRVKLKVPEGHSDYINASPIELTCTKSGSVLKYIATQGPKIETYSHFWRMVWNETSSPAVIVMLTQTVESGREKCFQYYPRSPHRPELKLNVDDEFEDGFIHSLKLASLKDHAAARAQMRELEMTSEDGSETRRISHLLFGAWPDFLVPEGTDQAALLNLIDLSREKADGDLTNPRIVHCSAGVGRSGTFIALDWLLQELEEGSLDDLLDGMDPIIAVVETLRAQRMMMVQSEGQLVFIYDVLRQRWRERWVHQHRDDAEHLGVTTPGGEEQPRLKRQKSMRTEISVSEQSNSFKVQEERAQLEAELMDAEMVFEKGKT